MSLNDTPGSSRIHIGLFGCRNVGKSSLMNAVTGQDLAVVSAVKGTTTDPVRKAMELLGTGRRTVRETAAEVGFADASFFTRTFTRRVGTPPSKWAQHAAQTLSDKDGQPSRGGRRVP